MTLSAIAKRLVFCSLLVAKAGFGISIKEITPSTKNGSDVFMISYVGEPDFVDIDDDGVLTTTIIFQALDKIPPTPDHLALVSKILLWTIPWLIEREGEYGSTFTDKTYQFHSDGLKSWLAAIGNRQVLTETDIAFLREKFFAKGPSGDPIVPNRFSYARQMYETYSGQRYESRCPSLRASQLELFVEGLTGDTQTLPSVIKNLANALPEAKASRFVFSLEPAAVSKIADALNTTTSMLLSEEMTGNGHTNTLVCGLGPLKIIATLQAMLKKDAPLFDENSMREWPILTHDLNALVGPVMASPQAKTATFVVADDLVFNTFQPRGLKDLQKMAESPAQTAKTVNELVAKATNNLITELLQPADVAGAKLVLASTLYFKDNWQEKFKKEERGLFKTNGQNKEITFLTGEQPQAKFYPPTNSDSNELMLKLPFKGHYVLYLARGADRQPLAIDVKAIKDMDEKLDGSQKDAKVDVRIPKLTMRKTIDLRAYFDFASPLLLDAAGDFNADVFKQENVFNTTLEGAEAGSASVLVAKGRAPERRVITFDEPFGFAIYDTLSGVILMAGTVYEP